MHNWPPLSAITCHTHICIGYKSALITCHPRMLHSLCVLFIQHHKFIQCGQKCSHHNSSGSFNAFKQLKSKTTHLDPSANTNVVRVSRFNLGIHKGITYWTQLISHPSVIVLTPTWCLHIYHYKTPWYHLYTLDMTYTLLIPWLARYKFLSSLSVPLPTGFMKEMVLI